MSLIRSEGSGDADLGFYSGVTSRSAKFHDGDSDHLKLPAADYTASSGTDRRKITHSVWIKRGTLGSAQSIYSSTQNGVSDYYLYRFNADDTIDIILDVNDSNWGYITTEKYRDVSSWYHFCLIMDTTQSTNTDRVKLYVNGTLQTLSTKYSGGHVNQNFEIYVMDGTEDAIGEFNYNSTTYFDGYMSDFITTVGQTNAIGDFGELNNGVWIPKEYDGSYGANGFRLEFKQTGTGTAGDSTVGADTSGNNRDWTSSGHPLGNILDNPENNFCTISPIDIGGHSPATNAVMTFAEGNLHISHNNTAQWQGHKSTFPVSSGKWYFEAQISVMPTGTLTQNYGIGFYKADKYNQLYYGLAGNLGFGAYSSNATTYKDTATTGYGAIADANGETYMVAVDFDNSKIWFGLEGSWMASGDPAAGSNPSISSFDAGTYVPHISMYKYSGQSTPVFIFNFGQEGTFSGSKTAGDNADDNGHGNFLYDVPAGFLAMCSANLSEPTIGPNSATQADDHFNAVIYSGDGNSQAITGVGFQPDLLWIKKRSGSDNHVLFDSTRGPSSGAKHRLYPNDVNPESDGGVTAFGADGFTVDGAYGSSGENNHTYVAYNWKANGGTTTTNDASATGVGDIDSVYQANTTAGFSIVKYTGEGSDNTNIEIAHGLGVAPRVVIVKNFDTASRRWQVYHEDLSADGSVVTENILLDVSTAESSYTSQIRAVSSTTFTVRDVDADGNGFVNANTKEYIAYCFADVAGYSKFGQYTGIGTADGPVIYTGFRPRWIMTKKISGSGNWYINDTARSPGNSTDLFGDNLYADLANGESGNGMDILSNGFKIRNTDASQNTSSGTYIYLAFAEAPFKYANGK